MSLPTGTLTFLFTDIEGSTKLWEAHPEAMRRAVARHDALLQQAVSDNNGHVFKTTGDGIAAVFPLAPEALAAALAAQKALLAEPWPARAPLRSRMGLHTGAAELRDGDYFGSALSRCARLMSAGHGGQTLLSDATHELTRDSLPPDVSLRLLGDYRLKDLSRPETVYQLEHPALAANFPPLRTLDVTPNNLPRQVTSFIGRETVVSDVITQLNKTRLLTLTGAGGAGKTRLCLQVAADVLEQFPDGVWLVELAPLADPALVPQAIASILGVKEQVGPSITQTLTSALQEKNLLLLLDNCEHLVSACAQFVATLVRACSNVKIVATSREALGIGGEQVYRVPSLSLPDPNASKAATPESLSQFESVRLFIERAEAVRSEFSVTNQNAPSLAQLCFHLDGIPLAIELAAARIRSLTVEQINDRLDNRFRLLTGGDRSALPRQQTLRALIDWSYDLLTETERTLLARLSVFSGGWTLEAAEAICGWDPIEDWAVLDILTSLADKSLILSEETTGARATRYRLLETVREYSAERLSASGEEAPVRRRHVDYLVMLAEDAEPRLAGPDQIVWLNRLEIEHDNLRVSLETCAATAALALSGMRLAAALVPFWRVRGYLSEGREHLERALAGRRTMEKAVEVGASDGTDVAAVMRVVAAALFGAGVLLSNQSDYPAARSHYAESLIVYREIGDKQGIARVLVNLGAVANSQGDYPAARALYEEGLALHREIGDKQGIARVLVNLGNLAGYQGEYPAARSLFEEGLALHREIGDKQSIADVLVYLGNVANHQGDYPGARKLYEEGLALHREIRGKPGIARVLASLGSLANYQGDYPGARSLFEESLALYREMGNKQGIATVLGNLGTVANDQGDYAAARLAYEESLTLYREIGSKQGVAVELVNLGTVANVQGDFAAARLVLEESLALYREIGDKQGIAIVLVNLGNLAAKQGDYPTAQSLHEESLALFREIGEKRGVAHALMGLASVHASNGVDVRLAAMLWAAAGALRESIGAPLSPHDLAELRAAVARARAALNDDAAWAAACTEGAALSWVQAVDIALRE